jgi:glycosyltransferase involved in cell wall biosynthesis
MACGVPVISSGGGALNEVLGGAATILNDCSDARALADAVRLAASDGPERRDMIARGLERARCFTRELSVCRTLEIYRSVVGR